MGVLEHFVIIVSILCLILQSVNGNLNQPTALIRSIHSGVVLYKNFSSTGHSNSPDTSDRLNYVTFKRNNNKTTNDAEQDTPQYKFECSATYPIEWIYQGEGLPLVVSYSRRLLNNLSDFDNPEKYNFLATLLVPHNEMATGEYICQSIHDPHLLFVSTFVFLQGEKYFIIDTPVPTGVFQSFNKVNNDSIEPAHYLFFHLKENSTRIHVVEHESSGIETWVTLPCIGSTFPYPGNIELYKVLQNTTLALQNISESTIFNPFLGFRLKLSDPWGSYVCKSKESMSSILFSVVPKQENSYISVELSEENEDIVFNCSTSYPMIHLQNIPCSSVMDCNFKKFIFRNSYIPLTTTVSNNQVIWKHPIARQTSAPIRGSHPKRVPILPMTGLFYCTAGRDLFDNVMFYRLMDNSIKILENELPEMETKDILELRVNQSVLIIGEETSFTCYGRSLYFSNGFLWKLETADGLEHFVYGDYESIATDDFIESIIKVRIEKKGKYVKGLTCYAPMSNSRKWITTKMEFNITSSGSSFSTTSGTILLIILVYHYHHYLYK